MKSVRPGIDRILADPRRLAGRRVGFLGHAASITAERQPVWPLLARQTDVVRLFGPEHGLDGAAQDMEGVGHGRDTLTGLPVVSLYGHDEASLEPSAADLDGIEYLVVDLVDVGSRYYTFLATLGLVLRACARRGIAVVVCDRPNPLGGELIEGPSLDPGIRSFVGLYPMPVVHGLTPGEFARWLVAHERLDLDLEVVVMDGWRRAMAWEDTGLAFPPPSPNMPTPDTARLYPGACLIEATNLSEGRGTTRPFEQIGAPFVDGAALAKQMNALDLPGVHFRPISFRPGFQKWRGETCHGVFWHVTDRMRQRPFRTGCELVAAIAQIPGFAWRHEPYEFRTDHPAIDLLTGSAELRRRAENREPLSDWIAGWRADEARWRDEREPFLLYRDPKARVAVSALAPVTTRPPAVAIVGRHNSGKTTLLVRLVETLSARGFRVGTVKHTPHPVDLDRPGKDSRRHAEAGAVRVALATPEATVINDRERGGEALAELLARAFRDVDLVLVEGYKTADLPKIEVLRRAISLEPLPEAMPRLAIVSDGEIELGVQKFGFDEVETLAAAIEQACGLRTAAP